MKEEDVWCFMRRVCACVEVGQAKEEGGRQRMSLKGGERGRGGWVRGCGKRAARQLIPSRNLGPWWKERVLCPVCAHVRIMKTNERCLHMQRVSILLGVCIAVCM